MLEAETIMQDVVQRRRRVFGPAHPDTVSAAGGLSRLRALIAHVAPPPASTTRLAREIEETAESGGAGLAERFAPLFPEDAASGLASLAARDPADVDAVLAQSGAKRLPILKFRRVLEAARARSAAVI